MDDARFLISGQGCKGVRCLRVGRQGATWNVEEKWFIPQIQYFYTNWTKLTDKIIVGCTDKYLAAFDLDDGKVLGRFRGFADGNVTIAGQSLVVLDGKGNLNLIQPLFDRDAKMTGLNLRQNFKLLDARRAVGHLFQ